ncbi:MAG: hypothetical protein LBT40_16785 [Deltaproteobacteria bacterium]|jgi:hypothetical protein|nr:hypothetical protein [Deltaproteobacteria bacterium]
MWRSIFVVSFISWLVLFLFLMDTGTELQMQLTTVGGIVFLGIIEIKAINEAREYGDHEGNSTAGNGTTASEGSASQPAIVEPNVPPQSVQVHPAPVIAETAGKLSGMLAGVNRSHVFPDVNPAKLWTALIGFAADARASDVIFYVDDSDSADGKIVMVVTKYSVYSSEQGDVRDSIQSEFFWHQISIVGDHLVIGGVPVACFHGFSDSERRAIAGAVTYVAQNCFIASHDADAPAQNKVRPSPSVSVPPMTNREVLTAHSVAGPVSLKKTPLTEAERMRGASVFASKSGS